MWKTVRWTDNGEPQEQRVSCAINVNWVLEHTLASLYAALGFGGIRLSTQDDPDQMQCLAVSNWLQMGLFLFRMCNVSLNLLKWVSDLKQKTVVGVTHSLEAKAGPCRNLALDACYPPEKFLNNVSLYLSGSATDNLPGLQISISRDWLNHRLSTKLLEIQVIFLDGAWIAIYHIKYKCLVDFNAECVRWSILTTSSKPPSGGPPPIRLV